MDSNQGSLISKPTDDFTSLATGIIVINVILFCPECGLQHIDRAGPNWTNPPHKSHLCHGCNWVWRPSDVATNGVSNIETKGRNDCPIHRGRARAVLNEQRRIEQIIDEMLQFDSPRLNEAKRNLLLAVKKRG